MATIRPFAGIRYASRPELDFSSVIAPPYDVLDEAGKAALQAKHPNNIVNVDLPWLPPKTVGPDEAYSKTNMTLQAWLSAGILKRDPRSAVYPYTQSYDHAGKTFHRRGLIATVKLSPFGQGQIVPHEKTYPSAIEDRLKLMRATGAQLSPIFGLFSDPRSEVTRLLYANLGLPTLDGTLNGVRNQLWEIHDNDVVNKVGDLMGARPIYIADGHHRYTTALQYQKEMEDQNGGPLPPNHPANFCIFVLVSMQDDGLLIFPTHRLIGGLGSFDINIFKAELGANGTVSDTPYWPSQIDQFMDDTFAKAPPNSFGVLDGKTKKIYLVTVTNLDVMKRLEPDHSDAWRKLDVAILQSYLLDQIIQKEFIGGKEITKGYTPDAKEAAAKTDGNQFQVAFLLRSTPLHALEDLGKTKEVMPQKSTYFYPKLATGMVINPIR
jgi:uncharacterized protein (DUF1015 family)